MIDRALRIFIGQRYALQMQAKDETRTISSLAGYRVRGTVKTAEGGTLLATFEGYVFDAENALAVAFLDPADTAQCAGNVSGYHYVEAYLEDETDIVPLSCGPVTFYTRDAS